MMAGLLGTAACGGDVTSPVLQPPDTVSAAPTFITVRRAWLPGEREARIAAVMANREWVFPMVGDLSDLAPVVFGDPDSVVVMRRASAPAPAGLQPAPQFSAGWDAFGVDVRVINTAQSPADTIDLIGVFWSNPGEPTWKGMVLMDRCTSLSGSTRTTCRNTRAPTGPGGNAIVINTVAFDASGAKNGAGAGEFRQTTGEYWEGNDGKIKVTSASYGAASAVTSGPFLGGTRASGWMGGQLEDIRMPRLLPSVNGSFITVRLSFESTPLSSVRLTCTFPSPCTGSVNAAVALRAAASAGMPARP